MQLLQTQPDGLHLCLLDDAELALLRRAEAEVAWREVFLRRLYALPLDETTANAVARSLKRYPVFFQDEEGLPMSLETWAEAVHAGGWSAPGVGPARLRKIAEALAADKSRRETTGHVKKK